jgi:hypothetical protein
VDQEARSEHLLRFQTLALRALGMQATFLFLEGGAYFKDRLAILALIFVEGHAISLLQQVE